MTTLQLQKNQTVIHDFHCTTEEFLENIARWNSYVLSAHNPLGAIQATLNEKHYPFQQRVFPATGSASAAHCVTVTHKSSFKAFDLSLLLNGRAWIPIEPRPCYVLGTIQVVRKSIIYYLNCFLAVIEIQYTASALVRNVSLTNRSEQLLTTFCLPDF